MFRKIVSNLPFSPSLISELGFYAKRLHKEEITRRTGLILTAFALVMQSLIVFSPPESANAANSSDLVHGGIHSKSSLLYHWDKNTQNFRDILSAAGITRQSLANTKDSEVHTRTKGVDNGWKSWNRSPRFGLQRGEVSFKVGSTTLYSRPLAAFDTGRNLSGSGSWYPAFTGTLPNGKPFGIMKGCANVLIKENPPQPPKPQPPVYKDITVCRLSDKKYPITIKENEFDPKKHSKNPEDCKEKPKPIALCSSLSAKKLSRTSFLLTANASTANGATISSYTFIVKNASGKEVSKKTVTSSSPSAQYEFSTNTEGTYSASVVVSTSLGDRLGTACQTGVTVSPIERCPLNPNLPINHPDCQPCPADETLWVKDEDCSAKVIRTKSAYNLQLAKPADSQPARSSDRIEYKLTATNNGKADAVITISDNITDVLEYAALYDNGGGTFDKASKVIAWPQITLKPGEQQTRTYVVQVASRLSPMPQGSSDPSSYDCRMTNTFGNTIDVHIDCPTPKVVEKTVAQLPKTGPGENMLFAGILAAIVTFFYLRSKQLNKEVRLIRREAAAGTL